MSQFDKSEVGNVYFICVCSPILGPRWAFGSCVTSQNICCVVPPPITIGYCSTCDVPLIQYPFFQSETDEVKNLLVKVGVFSVNLHAREIREIGESGVKEQLVTKEVEW